MTPEDKTDKFAKSFAACAIAALSAASSYVLGMGLIGAIERALYRINLNIEVRRTVPDFDLWLGIWPDSRDLFYIPGMLIGAIFGVLIMSLGIFLSLCLIGLPAHYAMQKRRVTGLLWHVVPATAIGILFLRLAFPATENTIRGWLSLCYPGLVAGLVFWFIRRPDLDDKSCVPPVTQESGES